MYVNRINAALRLLLPLLLSNTVPRKLIKLLLKLISNNYIFVGMIVQELLSDRFKKGYVMGNF